MGLILRSLKSDLYKKSNELSLAQLNEGLSLNEMQLLAFAIYNTQQYNITKFRKSEFEKYFGLEKLNTIAAYRMSRKIMNTLVELKDIENNYFEFIHLFKKMKYENGEFSFEWNEDIKPHILDLKQKHITVDLSAVSNFKCSYSWSLYERLKALYGYSWKYYSKEDLLHILDCEKTKSYVKNTNAFKKKVLEPSLKEINEFTEMKVNALDVKKGRSIIGFRFEWDLGKMIALIEKEQIEIINLYFHRSRQILVELIANKIVDDKDERVKEYIDLLNEVEPMIKSNEITGITFDYALSLTSLLSSIYQSLKSYSIDILDQSEEDKKIETLSKYIERIENIGNKKENITAQKRTKFHNFEQESDKKTKEEMENIAKRKREQFFEKMQKV